MIYRLRLALALSVTVLPHCFCVSPGRKWSCSQDGSCLFSGVCLGSTAYDAATPTPVPNLQPLLCTSTCLTFLFSSEPRLGILWGFYVCNNRARSYSTVRHGAAEFSIKVSCVGTHGCFGLGWGRGVAGSRLPCEARQVRHGR